MNSVILIPAYEPDEKLTKLISELTNLLFYKIIVVNDGSSKKCDNIFHKIEDSPNCMVIYYEVNRGKGAALKTGMKAILNIDEDIIGCITVDADGQHLPSDILKIKYVFEHNLNSLILGCRDFNKKSVPIKSKMGNLITRSIFKLLTGKYVQDTQTGLRAIPIGAFEKFCNLKGEKYEFEMNMLIEAAATMDIKEVKIQTVYIDGNKSSHFNPFLDSYRIYKEILKFCFSSLVCSIIDVAMFTIMYNVLWRMKALNPIFFATFIARIVSAFVNFTFNKNVVFKNKEPVNIQILKYSALCCVQMVFSWILVETISALGLRQVTFAKIIADIILFSISYIIQHSFIFKRGNVNEKT